MTPSGNGCTYHYVHALQGSWHSNISFTPGGSLVEPFGSLRGTQVSRKACRVQACPKRHDCVKVPLQPGEQVASRFGLQGSTVYTMLSCPPVEPALM